MCLFKQGVTKSKGRFIYFFIFFGNSPKDAPKIRLSVQKTTNLLLLVLRCKTIPN